MTDLMSASELQALVGARGDADGASVRLSKALQHRGAEYFRLGGGPASGLLPTYLARLEHATRLRLNQEGLEEFIAALRSIGDTRVLVAGVEADDWNFVILLSEDRSNVLGCIAVEAGERIGRG